jgi:hypothetical protein
MNRRTVTPAKIRRATRAAQSRLRDLDARTIEDLRGMYTRARDDIEAQIREAAGAGNLVREERLQHLRDQVGKRIQVLSEERGGLLQERLAKASQNGTDPWSGVVDANLTGIADEAVRFVREFTAEDGLQLSDRIWRLDTGARQAVTRELEQAVIQGHSASRAAQDFLARGESVPDEVAARAEMAKAENVAPRAADALMKGDRAPYEQARRVFRTELGRAHNAAFEAASFEHSDVVGMKFELSPRHPRRDICDMHAAANPYGLGPGVYPQGRNPYPAHPNTLSYIQPVFADEVTSEDEQAEDRISWLKRQSPEVQEDVLGSRAKRAALEQGLLKENQLDTPWKVLRRRYQSAGVDVEALERSAGAAVSPSAASGTAAPAFEVTPVSQSIAAESQKRVVGDVTQAIDDVHGDGELPRIPVRRSSSTRSHGVYKHIPQNGRPVEIRVSSKSEHQRLTLAHEIGHFLDNQAFGTAGRGYASESDDLFAAWREAVENSRGIRQLQGLLRNEPPTLPNGRQARIPRQYVHYLLRTREKWARSYAQYIAIRSGDRKMLDELDADRTRDAEAPIEMPRQWDDEDFEPIARAMDDIMRAKGWK